MITNNKFVSKSKYIMRIRLQAYIVKKKLFIDSDEILQIGRYFPHAMKKVGN